MKRARLLGLRGFAALLLLAVAPAFYAGCQSIAGIEERTLGQCGEFCDDMVKYCTGSNQVYATRDKCIAVCKLYDVGKPDEPEDTNTLACRLQAVQNVASDPNAEPDVVSRYCRTAGPEGLDCGGPCKSYCSLYARACSVAQCGSIQTCEMKCLALRDNTKRFSLSADHSGNSLQCRLVHVSNASVTPNPHNEHCTHSILANPAEYCIDPSVDESDAGAPGSDPYLVEEPTCTDYCRVNGVACQGADAMYETGDQCKALCKYFEQGSMQGKLLDKAENTLGCRLYHSYNSLCDPTHHCAHSGPGGEGHCGTTTEDKCISYCYLAGAICPTRFATEFGTDQDQCVSACKNAGFPDSEFTDDLTKGTRYNVHYALTPGTLACQLLALSHAAEGGVDSDHCSAAFGDEECKP